MTERRATARPTVIEVDLRLPLRGFTLQVAARLGFATAVVGPSGAGKTSLLESMAGLRRAEGRLRVGGELLQDSESGVWLPPERRRLGFVPQKGALFPHLTVRGNLLFGRRPPGESRDQRRRMLDDLVEALEIGHLLDRHPRNLSGGEVRRVAVARALLAHPRLLLLDEPTAGLDPERAHRTLQQIRRVTASSEATGKPAVPLLVVTHRWREAVALADDTLVMRQGRITARGVPQVVLGRRDLPVIDHDGRAANVVRGRVARHDREGGVTHVGLRDVGGGGSTITIPVHGELPEGNEVLLSVDAEELILAVEEPRGLSARNVFAETVTAVRHEAGSAFVQAGRWVVHLTAASARELELAPGRRVWLVVKTHSWTLLAG